MVNPENINKTGEQSTNSIIAEALADLHIDLHEFQSPPQSTGSQSHSDESQSCGLDSTNRQTVSNLWTSPTQDESLEVAEGAVLPELMEQHHKIRPTKTKKKAANPGMYDPMKV